MDNSLELFEIAVGILLRTGAIEACPEHPHIMIDQGNDDTVSRAYAMGTNQAKSDGVRATPAELRAAIKIAYQNVTRNCPECEREKHEDE